VLLFYTNIFYNSESVHRQQMEKLKYFSDSMSKNGPPTDGGTFTRVKVPIRQKRHYISYENTTYYLQLIPNKSKNKLKNYFFSFRLQKVDRLPDGGTHNRVKVLINFKKTINCRLQTTKIMYYNCNS
jgi:hypothetical protein